MLLLEQQVVGTASILLQDMQTNRDLSPWLANIYLAPAARGKGLGKWLVLQVMQQAQQLGLTKLYLFT
ncbi:GNAT family N-acetyltransferase, partial [Streptomyces sp. P17]|uniref:GNAT family N-acetyltransferase n=1 Tax=Streptomyces sp. P17 TaxID=3074716 RepID=UPI0028F41650